MRLQIAFTPFRQCFATSVRPTRIIGVRRRIGYPGSAQVGSPRLESRIAIESGLGWYSLPKVVQNLPNCRYVSRWNFLLEDTLRVAPERDPGTDERFEFRLLR